MCVFALGWAFVAAHTEIRAAMLLAEKKGVLRNQVGIYSCTFYKYILSLSLCIYLYVYRSISIYLCICGRYAFFLTHIFICTYIAVSFSILISVSIYIYISICVCLRWVEHLWRPTQKYGLRC